MVSRVVEPEFETRQAHCRTHPSNPILFNEGLKEGVDGCIEWMNDQSKECHAVVSLHNKRLGPQVFSELLQGRKLVA